MADSFSHRQTVTKPAVVSEGGIVAAQNRLAAQAGAAVLAGGGNAVDAAVATAFAIGVVEPWMSGVGGGGLLLHRDAASGRVRAWDFGMRTPRALDPADYPIVEGEDADLFGWPLVKDSRNLRGGTAIAVPGQVAGMAAVLQALGTLSWEAALAPAILLAERGVPLDWFSLLQIAQHAGDLALNEASAALYLEDGLPPAQLQPAVCLPNLKLRETLQHLARTGARDFYEGDLAARIVADVQAAGGCLSAEDLRGYQAREVEPLTVSRGQAELHVLPELNGGPTLARAVTRLGESWTGGAPDGAFYLAVAEALREAFANRLSHLGDVDGARGPSCTTHISVVDRDGNMVTLTQTLLSVFGSKVTLPSSGILMNNGVNWFDPRPGRPNSLGPDKRTLSNYVPVLGVTPERSFAIGASGGRKIIPAMTQLGLMLGVGGMTLEEALHQPRIDVSGPDLVTVDPRLDASIRSALAAVHPVQTAAAGFAPNNYATALAVLREQGRNHGAVEPLHPWAEAVSEDEVPSA